jgi:formylglycine-generating enzyme
MARARRGVGRAVRSGECLAFLILATATGCGAEGRAAPAPTATAVQAAAASAAPSAVSASPVAPTASSAAPTASSATPKAPADAGARSPTDCPDGMAKIGRYCIDKWEAHLVVRTTLGEIVNLPFFARPPEDGNYEARTEDGALPQGYISRVEAARACKNAGKRLCSKGEWQHACKGRRGAHYPYGSRWQADRCNMDKPHLLSRRFGADSRRWKYDQFNDPTLNQEPGFLVPTGSLASCASSYGVYDMVGNLHEWVSDTVDEALMEKLDAEEVERKTQSWRPGNGVFMGGFFSTHEQLGPGCLYTTVAHEPTYHDYSTGFRCCSTLPVEKKKSARKRRR